MDVYQVPVLVEQLFVEIEATGDREVQQREVLFKKLRKAIEDHTVIEETVFYPEIENYPTTKNSLPRHSMITLSSMKSCRKFPSCQSRKSSGWKE
jgi:hypothetical protein